MYKSILLFLAVLCTIGSTDLTAQSCNPAHPDISTVCASSHPNNVRIVNTTCTLTTSYSAGRLIVKSGATLRVEPAVGQNLEISYMAILVEAGATLEVIADTDDRAVTFTCIDVDPIVKRAAYCGPSTSGVPGCTLDPDNPCPEHGYVLTNQIYDGEIRVMGNFICKGVKKAPFLRLQENALASPTALKTVLYLNKDHITTPWSTTDADLVDLGWKAGDQVVIGSSTYAPSCDEDILTIERFREDPADPTRFEVTLIGGLKNSYKGDGYPYGDSEAVPEPRLNAEVINLTRNVKFTVCEDGVLPESCRCERPSYDPLENPECNPQIYNGFHLRFMGSNSKTIQIEGTEFAYAGQRSIQGRYPLHFHNIVDGATVAEVKFNSIHHSYHRGIVLHNSNGFSVTGNALHNIESHGITIGEDGKSHLNTVDFNIINFVTSYYDNNDPGTESGISHDHMAFHFTGPLTNARIAGHSLQSEENAGAIWATNYNNHVNNNIAAGGIGTNGFFLDGSMGRPDLGCDPQAPIPAFYESASLEFGDWDNNIAHSFRQEEPYDAFTPLTAYQGDGAGWFQDQFEPDAFPSTPEHEPVVVNNFFAYNCHGGGIWQESEFTEMENIDLLGCGYGAVMHKGVLRHGVFNRKNPNHSVAGHGTYTKSDGTVKDLFDNFKLAGLLIVGTDNLEPQKGPWALEDIEITNYYNSSGNHPFPISIQDNFEGGFLSDVTVDGLALNAQDDFVHWPEENSTLNSDDGPTDGSSPTYEQQLNKPYKGIIFDVSNCGIYTSDVGTAGVDFSSHQNLTNRVIVHVTTKSPCTAPFDYLDDCGEVLDLPNYFHGESTGYNPIDPDDWFTTQEGGEAPITAQYNDANGDPWNYGSHHVKLMDKGTVFDSEFTAPTTSTLEIEAFGIPSTTGTDHVSYQGQIANTKLYGISTGSCPMPRHADVEAEVVDGPQGWWDLLGRKIERPLTPGMYIHDGELEFVADPTKVERDW